MVYICILSIAGVEPLCACGGVRRGGGGHGVHGHRARGDHRPHQAAADVLGGQTSGMANIKLLTIFQHAQYEIVVLFIGL